MFEHAGNTGRIVISATIALNAFAAGFNTAMLATTEKYHGIRIGVVVFNILVIGLLVAVQNMRANSGEIRKG